MKPEELNWAFQLRSTNALLGKVVGLYGAKQPNSEFETCNSVPQNTAWLIPPFDDDLRNEYKMQSTD